MSFGIKKLDLQQQHVAAGANFFQVTEPSNGLLGWHVPFPDNYFDDCPKYIV